MRGDAGFSEEACSGAGFSLESLGQDERVEKRRPCGVPGWGSQAPLEADIKLPVRKPNIFDATQ